MRPEDLEVIKKLDLKAPYVWLATWFGSGFFRPAPGTWGSAFSIPPALIIHEALGMAAFLIGLVFITAMGFWSTERFEEATESHDNSMIVIDEAAGQWDYPYSGAFTLWPFTAMDFYWICAFSFI